MAKELSQSARRRNHVMTDQHGRKWETTLDFIANGPCAPINPKDFQAPLMVHQKYLKFQPENPTELVIDYDPWIGDVEKGWKDWDTLLYNDAIMLFGQAGPQMYETRAVALLKHTGQPPEPVELIKAARAGNKWVLGLSDKVPEWALPFIKRASAQAEEFPDVDDVDKYGDVEEQHDPKAQPKKLNPRKNNTKAEAA